MKLKEFLEAYCDKDMGVDVTDDWGEDYTIQYHGSVERLLKYPDIYAEELKRKVKRLDTAEDVDYDTVLMILVSNKDV
mgnify:CR=1 FL=1